ncbi:MAG: flagellar biosynthetic protein FliR [Thermoleophilia bacterium]|jgi:flagellar biosynthetic protein FliR|nr:flagellar biosynthetic protein FliR [Thermoleophilia bacterium]
MEGLLEQIAPMALVFALMTIRLGAMMASAPVFSARTVPVRVKGALVVLLAVVSLPMVAGSAGTPPADVVSFALLAVKEAIIGVAFGLVAQMLFAAVQMAGALIDLQAGFAISQVVDPASGTSVTVLGKFYNLVAISAFLAIGGAQWLVAGIVRSFELVPPLATPDLGAVVQGVLAQADDIVLVAVQIGAPILVALFVADVALGIVARSVPQMNVFIVGLPLKVGIALVGTAILLPTTVAYIDELSGRMLSDLSAILRAAGG